MPPQKKAEHKGGVLQSPLDSTAAENLFVIYGIQILLIAQQMEIGNLRLTGVSPHQAAGLHILFMSAGLFNSQHDKPPYFGFLFKIEIYHESEWI